MLSSEQPLTKFLMDLLKLTILCQWKCIFFSFFVCISHLTLYDEVVMFSICYTTFINKRHLWILKMAFQLIDQ